MSKTLYDDMLAAYGLTTERQRRQAIHEVDRQVVLAGLYNGGFFDEAAFYGGTCLCVFHSLERFSEDMDFSLIKPDSEFELQKYFQPIVDEFVMMGRRVEIRMTDKRSQSAEESAFLKDNTEVCDVVFLTDKSIKIKIEVDTCPPMGFRTEQRLLLMPQSFMPRCYSLPDLFAGKAHAIVYMTWNNRVKGRDWYDFEWYVRHNVLSISTISPNECASLSGWRPIRHPFWSGSESGSAAPTYGRQRQTSSRSSRIRGNWIYGQTTISQD